MRTKIYGSRDAKSRIIVIAVVAAAALLLALAVFGLFRALRKPEGQIMESENAGLTFDASAEEGGWESLSREEIEAGLNQTVAEGMINISMNTAPYFTDGASSGNIMVVNETINRYPQKVEIIRNDTDEVIYTSGAIPVGSKIEQAKLDVELEAGTYECTAMFHNLDPQTGNVIGTAGAIINITIQN